MTSRFEQFSAVISGIYWYIQKLERVEMIRQGYKGSFAQYLVAMNHFEDGLTSARLCEICDKDKAAVSRAIGEMESMGLVTRESTGDSRYRAKIRLTDQGKEAARYVSHRAQIAVEAVGNELSEEERKVFYQTLDRIFTKIQVLTKEGIPQNR